MDKTPGHQYTVRLPMDTDLQALRSTLHSPLGKRSRKLVRESRVYRVTANGQERSALVLSDLQPEEVHLRFVGDSIDWTCSCQDTAPCAHIVALLWQQADHGALSPTLASLFSEVQTQSNKPASSTTTGRKRNPARSEQELFLFDLDDLLSSTTANTPPQQPSLFDQAAETPPATDRPAVDQPAADQPAEPPLQASTPAQASATLPTATISPTANPPVGANTPLANTAPAHTHPAQEKKVHPWEVQRASPNAADAWAHLDILDLEPRFQIQFAETLGRTDIRLLVRYGDFTMSTSDKTPIYHIAGTNRGIRRNLNAETQFRRQLATKLSADLAWERGAYADLVGNDGPDWGLVIPLADFLLQTGRELMEQGFDILVMGRKILGTGALKVNAEHDLDWFGVNATIQLQEADPAARLAAGTMLHLMADQSIAPVPGLVSTKEGYVALSESDLRRLKFLRQHGMDANGQLHSSSVNLNLIDTLYDSLENRDDPVVQSSREALAEISTILQAAYSSVHAAQHDIDAEFDVPAQPAMLHARLRIYQLIGFAWLRSLHKYGYGACLADDMGLGKTMQTLALLCSLKEEGRLGPSLLITPVVTLSNWEAELRRFAPDLSFIRHQGTRRIQDAAHLRSHDLVIVSYQTLRNDLDLFAAHVWDCLILDEAHYIKSADSQIFKAVRVLSGKHRLSLTGTPIENNTMELHAQFSFLNPGLLGTAAEFQEQFAGPIERKGDPEAARALKDTVRPFILRRKKQDVLAELPDKNE